MKYKPYLIVDGWSFKASQHIIQWDSKHGVTFLSCIKHEYILHGRIAKGHCPGLALLFE